MPKETSSHFKALDDTLHGLSNDFYAQIHVIKFCLDEIGQYLNRDGREFLRRMQASANNINVLVDSCYGDLWTHLRDNDVHLLSDVYSGLMALINNHYLAVLENINFGVQENLNHFSVKNGARKLVFQLFALYSFYLDDLKGEY